MYGVFFVAPEDADQGIIQKIFYFHVAIAMVALLAFLVAAIEGIRYLRDRETRHDEVSCICVGIGLAFSVLVVITGSIWAKASWGTWWVWTDPRLVTFVIVLLLYAAYFVLRSSAEGERQARYSAIYSDRGVRIGAPVVLLGAGGALVRAPGRLQPGRRQHAGLACSRGSWSGRSR